MSEIGEPGSWWRIFNEPNLAKQWEPTLEGVDSPTLGITQAYYDDQSGVLWVRTCTGTRSLRGSATTWRVTKLPDPTAVKVTCDGEDVAAFRVVGDNAIEIDSDVHEHVFRVEVSNHGQRPQVEERVLRPAAASDAGAPVAGLAEPRAGDSSPQPEMPRAATASGCSCCAPVKTPSR